MVNKPLIRPYFLGGGSFGGGSFFLLGISVVRSEDPFYLPFVFIGVVEKFLQHETWAFLGPKAGLLQLSCSYGSWSPSLKLMDSLPLKNRQANPKRKPNHLPSIDFQGLSMAVSFREGIP